MRAVLLALAGALLFAAPAQAAITGSTITSPADGTFPVDNGTDGTVTVSGTATHTGTGESVKIICSYQDNGVDGFRPGPTTSVSDADGSGTGNKITRHLTLKHKTKSRKR
jgi:hypothetical protein